jgi:hypothetical protein
MRLTRVGTARAVRIFKTYGADAVQLMSETRIAWPKLTPDPRQRRSQILCTDFPALAVRPQKAWAAVAYVTAPPTDAGE